MDPSLKRLFFYHYKKSIAILAIIISAIYLFQTVSGIISWKNSESYFSSEKAVQDFDEKLKDSYQFEDQEKGKIFLYYDLKKDKTVYTDNFKDFKDYSLTFFNSNEDANQQNFNAYPYYNEHFLLLLIIFAVVGLSLFLMDLKSNFNVLLFTSKYKRSSIYLYKYYYIGGTLSLALLASKIVSIVTYRFFIPSNYLNISLFQQIASSMSGWVTLISIFMISSFFGLVIGNWLFGTATVITLFLTFNRFLSNIDSINQTLFVSEVNSASTVTSNMLNNMLPLRQVSIQPINIEPLIILVILSCTTFFIGQKLFGRVSLEDIGSFILIPKLKRSVQFLIIIYGLVTLSTNTFLMTAFPEDSITNFEQLMNYSKIGLTFLILYFFTTFILYNKKPLFLTKINL